MVCTPVLIVHHLVPRNAVALRMPSPVVNNFGGWVGPASRLQDSWRQQDENPISETVAEDSCTAKLILNMPVPTSS